MKVDLALVSIRVPQQLKDVLDAEAAREERSTSNFVVRILRQHMAKAEQREVRDV